MSMHVRSPSMEEIHRIAMRAALAHPDCSSSPRGKPVRELIAASFTLTNPRNRLVLSPARAVNYGFAVGELCWYLRGDCDLATMLYYNKRMAHFSDDGQNINSAYGARIMNPSVGGKNSQWEFCLTELANDPDSRRAVMHINQPRDLWRAVTVGSKDVPCTLSIQLLLRSRMLHMHVVMRSNDIVWGLPYDVFSFTCLQEAFMLQLMEAGAPVDGLGSYHHTVGSLHIYDTHYELGEQVCREEIPKTGPMLPFTLAELEVLSHEWEPDIRENYYHTCRVRAPESHELNDTAVHWMTRQLYAHRQKRIDENSPDSVKRRIEKKHEQQA